MRAPLGEFGPRKIPVIAPGSSPHVLLIVRTPSGRTQPHVPVEHIARGLRLELEGTGARVSIIQLGPAQSEFGFGWEPERMKEALAAWNEARVWSHPAMMAAEDVARGVVLALTAPRSVEVHDLVMKPTHGPGDGQAG